MKIFKRLFLFFLINFCVITTLSIIISVFGLGPVISSYGLNTKALFTFCLIWGMGGSIISLLLSKKIAKWMMNIKILNGASSNFSENEVYNIAENLARIAHLKHMPEIGIYSSNEVNAFATGPNQKNSLIALSTGLINRMEKEDIEAVIAHEISHIQNGDMVTMTLLQGIVNAFVMFLSRMLAYLLIKRDKNRSFSYLSYSLFTYLFQFIFMLIGSIGICAFSRAREFSADRSGADLVGKDKMINALNNLRALSHIQDPKLKTQSAAINSLKISNFSKNALSLFSTHPPLEKRIERLRNNF